jgi:hypothetical protein
MKLDRKVRHKSEDIEDDVLLDVVQAIKRRVRVVSDMRWSTGGAPLEAISHTVDRWAWRPSSKLCSKTRP